MRRCIAIFTVYVSLLVLSPLPSLAQTTSENIIDSILRQYEGILRDHTNLVDSSRSIVDSTEEEFIRSLLNQIDGAEQVVQDTHSSGISIQIDPPYPEPHQEIKASFAGYGINLNEAMVSWFVDGRLVRSGYGLSSIKTVLGSTGEATIISATVEPIETASFTRSRIIVPNTIDLLWEAVDAYVPPFYKGKALPSYDSIVKLTAITNIFDASRNKVKQEDLVYSWSLNGRKRDLSAYSGYGKNTAYALGSFLNKGYLAGVEISNSARGVDVRKSTLFILNDPEIIFYRKEPLGGVKFENALGAQVSIEREDPVRLVAFPYSFDLRNGFDDLNMSWKLNNNTIKSTGSMLWGEIPLTSQVKGISRLGIEISTSKILQKAKRQIEISVE